LVIKGLFLTKNEQVVNNKGVWQDGEMA